MLVPGGYYRITHGGGVIVLGGVTVRSRNDEGSWGARKGMRGFVFSPAQAQVQAQAEQV